MAKRIVGQSPTPIAPALHDLKVERFHWGDLYTGTKEALIAAGHAADGQFPGDPGRASTSCSYYANGEPCRRGVANRESVLKLVRYGEKFQAWVTVNEEEQKRRRANRDAADEWRKKAAEAEAEVKREADKLAELPATGEDWAGQAAQTFWAVWNAFYRHYMQPKPDDAGYRFTRADRDVFEGLADGLYWEILNAEPQFDATRRMLKVTEARAKAAKVDMPLQQLLLAAEAQATSSMTTKKRGSEVRKHDRASNQATHLTRR